IPKPDGRQRPLAIAALEDKIVQRAAAAVLNAIYEEDFLGFSYGFRPGRGTHDALDALDVGINSTKVNWIVDADIRSFFDEISQEWLVRFLEHRIGDRRIIRLIQKWLKVGCPGRRDRDGQWQGDRTGLGDLTAPGQHLPLCPAATRSKDRAMRCSTFFIAGRDMNLTTMLASLPGPG